MAATTRKSPPKKAVKPAPPMPSLTASGEQVDLSDKQLTQKIHRQRAPWQQLAWNYRELIGELGSGIEYEANIVSKVHYVVGQVSDEDEPTLPTSDEYKLPDHVQRAAQEALDALPFRNGYAFTGVLSTCLRVTGEAWLHGRTEKRREIWSVLSSDEVTPVNNTLGIVDMPGTPPRPVDKSKEVLLRLWKPHPRWKRLADSPLRRMLDTCEDIVLIGRELRAAARSRVAANGILLVPNELSVVRKPDGSSDDFQTELEMTLLAPIANEGDAGAVVPVVLKGPADLLEKVRHITLQREDAPQLIEKLESALRRLREGMDMPPDAGQSVADMNHWCVDTDTEILTRRGWLTEGQLEVGDVALTLNHDTGLSEWAPVLDIYRADVRAEPMTALRTRNHDSLTTAGHRWPVLHGGRRDWTTTDQLTSGHGITMAAPSADLPEVAKWSDDLVELVAWFWTEGSYQPTPCIAQSHSRNPERVARIRVLLTRMFGPASTTLRGTGWPAWREKVQANAGSYGGPVTVFYLNQYAAAELRGIAPDKRVDPHWVTELTMAQLALFIDVSGQGDGQHYRSGSADMWQARPDALDAYELALILSGRTVRRSDAGRRVGVWRQSTARPVKAALQAAGAGGRAEMRTRWYTGTVWCPVTRNGTWFARRGGTSYYTGNSAWSVSQENWKNYLEPHTRLIVDSLTEAYLRPSLMMPAGKGGWGLSEDEADLVQVWYDAGNVTENANRAMDARELYDRGEVGGEYLRTSHGASKGDAPTDEEMRRMITWKASQSMSPEVVQALIAQAIGGDGVSVNGQSTPTPRAIEVSRPESSGETTSGAPTSGTSGTQPTQPVPSGVVAAVNPQRVLDSVTLLSGDRLAEIERALRDRLVVAADDALVRALEKAGSRVRASLQQKDKTLAADVKGLAAEDVCPLVGQARIAELGIREDTLLGRAFDYLAKKFTAWTTQAVRDVARTVADLAGLTLPQVAALVSKLSARIPTAWKTLEARLQARALDRLYGRGGDEERGEIPDTIVSPGDIRAALSEIGGAAGTDGAQAGGLALGTDVTGVIDEQADRVGFSWKYGITPRERQFEPHRQLNGHRFESWSDAGLATNAQTAWVGTHYAPGDHDGCLCDYVPTWAILETFGTIDQEIEPENVGSISDRVLAQLDDAAGRRGTHAQRNRDERDRILAVQREWMELTT